MAALNEAYRVLRNPGRRARYDAERRRPTRREPSPEASVTEAPPAVDVVRGGAGNGGPARYPWKLVLVLATLGVGIVLIGAALFEPTAPEDPDNLLEPGSCVAIEDNGDVREVRCQGTSDDLVVRQVVPFDGFCPVGLDAHRDRQGLGIACVSRLD